MSRSTLSFDEINASLDSGLDFDNLPAAPSPSGVGDPTRSRPVDTKASEPTTEKRLESREVSRLLAKFSEKEIVNGISQLKPVSANDQMRLKELGINTDNVQLRLTGVLDGRGESEVPEIAVVMKEVDGESSLRAMVAQHERETQIGFNPSTVMETMVNQIERQQESGLEAAAIAEKQREDRQQMIDTANTIIAATVNDRANFDSLFLARAYGARRQLETLGSCDETCRVRFEQLESDFKAVNDSIQQALESEVAAIQAKLDGFKAQLG